jgi:hypothetical protein
MHLVLVDEADRMSDAAQVSLLSKLDATNFPPSTIFIFTSNDSARLRVVDFSSYGLAAETTELLARIWNENAPSSTPAPNFARLVKNSNNNVRESLMRLETELMLA